MIEYIFQNYSQAFTVQCLNDGKALQVGSYKHLSQENGVNVLPARNENLRYERKNLQCFGDHRFFSALDYFKLKKMQERTFWVRDTYNMKR